MTILLSSCCFLALSACNQAPQGPPDPKLKAALVGKWEQIAGDGGDYKYEFTNDGKVFLRFGGIITPYVYEWIGPKRIEWKQDVKGGGSPGARATITIDDDVLTMDITFLTVEGKERSDGGSVRKFKRVK
jgi:hypothetical protein